MEANVLAKSPAQTVAANALRMTSNALSIATYKYSTDHGCGNLSVFAERTQFELLEDILIDLELLNGVAKPALESVMGFFFF